MRYEEKVKMIVEEFVQEGGLYNSEFPEMELYMDQAANFMNQKLNVYKKDPKDQVITKTMIGNYVKHKLLPRPQNKKYCKDHLILLTFIYYLKSTFQMDDIEKLMKPIVDNYNSEFDEKISIGGVYESVANLQEEKRKKLLADTVQDIYNIKDSNNKLDLADDDILEMFMLIVDLSMKADFQKFLAQRLMDEYFLKPKAKPQKKAKVKDKAKVK